MNSESMDGMALVARALREAGVPVESAEMFAHIAVEEIRKYLWNVLPCRCDIRWLDQSIRDPQCCAHDYDVELGGNGDGMFMTSDMQREHLAFHAMALRDRYGNDVYRKTFAPVYAKLLEEMNYQEDLER